MGNRQNITRCCCCCYFCCCCPILPSWPPHTLYQVEFSLRKCWSLSLTLSTLNHSSFRYFNNTSHRTITRLLLTINNHFFHSWCILTYDFIIKRPYNGGKYLILPVIEVAFIGLIKCYLYVYIWSLKIVCYHNIFKSSFIYSSYYIFLRNLLYPNFENDRIYCKLETHMHTLQK